jgi:two-component system LytT family sensor kinase
MIALKFNKLSKPEIIKHSLNWIIFGVFDSLFDPALHGSFFEILKDIAAFVIPCMLVYYCLALIIYPSFSSERRLALLLSLVVIYLLFAFMDYLNTGYRVRSGEKSLGLMFLDALLIVGLTGIAAFSSFTNRQARILIREQDRKEKDLIAQEVNSIETQFNSELTSKFLKFISNEVKLQSVEAASAVELYSNIIKYTFTTKPDEPVPLGVELDFLSSYINLQRSIYADTFVDILFKGDIQTLQIYPRILVSFVENAFKHGITNDPFNPVTILLEIYKMQIFFKVENKKNKVKIKVVSGLGQKNVKDVLNIFYFDRYQLKIRESPESYSALLVLSI